MAATQPADASAARASAAEGASVASTQAQNVQSPFVGMWDFDESGPILTVEFTASGYVGSTGTNTSPIVSNNVTWSASGSTITWVVPTIVNSQGPICRTTYTGTLQADPNNLSGSKTVEDLGGGSLHCGTTPSTSQWTARRISDLKVDATVNFTTPEIGETIAFSVTITNATPGNDTGVSGYFSLPRQLTFVEAFPSQGTIVGNPPRWAIGDLGPGASATLTLNARVRQNTTAASLDTRFSAWSTRVRSNANQEARADANAKTVTVAPFLVAGGPAANPTPNAVVRCTAAKGTLCRIPPGSLRVVRWIEGRDGTGKIRYGISGLNTGQGSYDDLAGNIFGFVSQAQSDVIADLQRLNGLGYNTSATNVLVTGHSLGAWDALALSERGHAAHVRAAGPPKVLLDALLDATPAHPDTVLYINIYDRISGYADELEPFLGYLQSLRTAGWNVQQVTFGSSNGTLEENHLRRSYCDEQPLTCF